MKIPRYHLPDSRWPQSLPDLKKSRLFEVTPIGVAYCLLGLVPECTSVSELYSDRLMDIRKTLRGHAIDIAKQIHFPVDRIRADCSLIATPTESLLDVYFQKPVIDSVRKIDERSDWLEIFNPGGAWEDIYFQKDDGFHLVVRQMDTLPLVFEYLEFLGCERSRVDYFAVQGSKEYEWLEVKGLVAGDLPDIYDVIKRDSPIIISVNHDSRSRIRYPATIVEISLILCVFMKYRDSGVPK